MKRELSDVLFDVLETWQAGIHTITVGKVTAVREKTIDVQPVVNSIVDGVSRKLPLLIKVPPVFLTGGASYVALPITVGDYALIFITERSFDRWYAGVDNEPPLEFRMHDYSDGFALVGLEPFASAITIPSETTINGIMRLGVANPTDFAALAGKVLAELDLVKADFDALKAAYDAHTHTSSGSGPPGAPLPAAHTPASVASAFVKAN